MNHRIIIVGVLALVGISALAWSRTRRESDVVSGFLEADEIRVGSRVGGRVQSVRVIEGQELKGDEILLELEPYDLERLRAEAEANLAAAEATLAKMKAGSRPQEIARAKALRDQAKAALAEGKAGSRAEELKEGEANLSLALAELSLAKESYGRAESLYRRQSITREEFDAAQTQLKVAQSSERARLAQLDLLKAGTRPEKLGQLESALAAAEAEANLVESGFRAEEVGEAVARRDAAQASLEAIRERIRELNVRAPRAGVVEAIDVHPGDLIAASAPVVAVLDMTTLRVRAYVPERMLARVKVGQEVRVVVDSLPERSFRARVSAIAHQAEFSPGNVQTPEERAKQVFRVRVELLEGHDVLRPGMAADLRFDGVGP